MVGNIVIHEKGLRHWARVSDTSRFNHNTIKTNFLIFALLPKRIQSLNEIATNRAANATIAHLDDVFFVILNQNIVINILLAKLVLNHSNFFAVVFGEDVFEQSGFAAS
jgi:hypothetical protein